MEEAALDEAAGGAWILPPTNRLADRYRHAARLRHFQAGAGGGHAWESPAIMEFRAWIRSQFALLWDLRYPAGAGAQLRLWHDALQRSAAQASLPPPEGFHGTPSLYCQFQASYDIFHERRLIPKGAGDGRMAAWRQEVFGHYERLLSARGFISWHQMVEAVTAGYLDGALRPPGRVILPIPRDPPPLYADLIGALGERTDLEIWRLAPAHGHPPTCSVWATAEQECRAAAAHACRAWEASGGGVSMALVAPDEGPLSLISRSLEEMAGRKSPGEGFSFWDAPAEMQLVAHPLYSAAVFPLNPPQRGIAEALSGWIRSAFAPPELFPSFEKQVLEPLLGRDFQPSWDEAVALAARRFPALGPMVRLSAGGTRPLAQWIQDLEAIWDALGFFQFGGRSEVRDACASAEESLRSALGDLSSHCGDLPVDREGAASWIEASVEGLLVKPRPRRGGIQVLKASEMFGLPFDEIWTVGVHGRQFPPPPEPRPLFSPRERLALEDGDAALHTWTEGLRALQGILASVEDASAAIFSRPLLGADGNKPTLPSPYFEEPCGEPGARSALTLDIWGAHRSDWMESPWMAGASAGMENPIPLTPHPADATPFPLPGDLRATVLDDLLQCPFRYFARAHLDLKSPEEPQGLSPAKRGTILHRILDRFSEALNRDPPPDGWPHTIHAAWACLRQIAADVFGTLPDSPACRAELALLLGDDEWGSRSVLGPWLEAERGRALEGWRILPPAAEGEHPFRDLRLDMAGVSVHGKADRVDQRMDSLAVWDYKTGVPPRKANLFRDLNQGQLPAYAAALRAGLLTPGATGSAGPVTGPIHAGFIAIKPLKSVPRGFHVPMEPEGESWEDFLTRWQKRLGERVHPARSGLYAADPVLPSSNPGDSGTACANCPYYCLCGYFDTPRRAASSNEEEAE